MFKIPFKNYISTDKGNVFVLGSECGKHTEKSTSETAINNWNNDITSEVYTSNSKEFCSDDYVKHLSDDVFTVKYVERSTGKIYEVNPCIDNAYFDNIYRENFRTGEYVLISGLLPNKWK